MTSFAAASESWLSCQRDLLHHRPEVALHLVEASANRLDEVEVLAVLRGVLIRCDF